MLIDGADLHGSLHHPVLGSINFLNEIMDRYPDAVSLAPGAPQLAPVGGADIAACVDRFLDHVRSVRGVDRERARRLLTEYGPARGLINDIVADALRAAGHVDVPPEALVITVGAQEAMLLTLRTLFRPGRDVLAVADPCFVGIAGAARLLDIGIVPVSETEDGIDLDRLAAACREARGRGKRIRALYAAPDFSNPSGNLLDLSHRRRLLDLAEAEDFLILEDNAYAFTAPPGQELPPLKALDGGGRVILIGTFAKVCMPGARVGFVVADQEVRSGGGERSLLSDAITAVKSMTTVNTSPVSQAVIGGMLLEHGGSLDAMGRRKAALYRRNLAHLLEALDRRLAPGGEPPPGVRWNRPPGGFFVLMRLPVEAGAELLELSASKFGVLWTPMAPFHIGGGGANELRLSCSYLDPEGIDEGVARLAGLVRHAASGRGGGGAGER